MKDAVADDEVSGPQLSTVQYRSITKRPVRRGPARIVRNAFATHLPSSFKAKIKDRAQSSERRVGGRMITARNEDALLVDQEGEIKRLMKELKKTQKQNKLAEEKKRRLKEVKQKQRRRKSAEKRMLGVIPIRTKQKKEKETLEKTTNIHSL